MENEPALPTEIPGLTRRILKSTARIGAFFAVLTGVVLLFFSPGCACTTKEQAYIAAMKDDLRLLTTSQWIYYSENDTYTTSLAALSGGFNRPDAFPSPGITVIVDSATPEGFSAHASHDGTSVQCRISDEDQPTPDQTVQAGEIYCSQP